MFVYGIAYAVASIGCTLPLFVVSVFGPGRVLEGVANALAYGLGMGLLVTALTVTLAAANTGLLRVLRSNGRYIELIAAAFVLLSGLYLVYYFWVVDVNERSDGVTGAVESFRPPDRRPPRRALAGHRRRAGDDRRRGDRLRCGSPPSLRPGGGRFAGQ